MYGYVATAVHVYCFTCRYHNYYDFKGDITIPNGITITLVSTTEANPAQFILTCISTGGPATTVTWTRDSQLVSGRNVTVLDDREAPRYTHTLSVTGSLEGLYQCNVSNDKPSTASAKFLIQGITRDVT